VRHLGLLHLQLSLGHTDTPLLAPIEIERDRHTDHDVVVRAQSLLAAEVQHWIWTQAGLHQPAVGRLDVRAGSANVRVLNERAHYQVVDGGLARRRRLSESEPRPPAGHRKRQDEDPGPRPAHGAESYRTGTENLVDPLPAGPSQLTVTWRVPVSG